MLLCFPATASNKQLNLSHFTVCKHHVLQIICERSFFSQLSNLPFRHNWKFSQNKFGRTVVNFSLCPPRSVNQKQTQSFPSVYALDKKKTIRIYEDNLIKMFDQICEWFGELLWYNVIWYCPWNTQPVIVAWKRNMSFQNVEQAKFLLINI